MRRIRLVARVVARLQRSPSIQRLVEKLAAPVAPSLYNASRVAPLILATLSLAEEATDAAIAKRDELAGLSAMFIARSAQSVHSAAILSASGLIGDAMSVARTPVEMAIDLAYIAKDPAVRIKKFTDYDDVSKFKLAKAVAKLHDGAVPKAAMDELKRRADAAKTNNPDSKQNWAGVTLKDRATEAEREQLYELLYTDMCNASHSCYGSLEYTLIDLKTEPKIHFGNMAADDKPAILAASSLLIMVSTVADVDRIDKSFGHRTTELADKLHAVSLANATEKRQPRG